MNNKGQALVEFILILPVILIILMGIISIGNIYIEKYKLNNILDTCVSLYLNDKNDSLKAYMIEEDISFDATDEGELTKITISKKLDLTVPIVGEDYTISTSKKVYNDE